MTGHDDYTAARQMINPDADYVVQVRTGTGWRRPAAPEERELPGLDVLLAARRVLRTHPAGSIWTTHPETLSLRTGDGRLLLRFVLNTVAKTKLCPTDGCAEFLPPTGPCPQCNLSTAPEGRAQEGLWRVLGRPSSAVTPVTRDDLTLADLTTLAHTCHTLHTRNPLSTAALEPEAARLLRQLTRVMDALDEDRPDALEIEDCFSRTQLLTLAEAALTLYRAHGDPDDLLGPPEGLLLAHLAYDDLS